MDSPRVDHVALVYQSRAAAMEVLGGCFGFRLLRSFVLGEDPARALFGLAGSVEVLVFGTDRRMVEAFVCEGTRKEDRVSHICLVVHDLPATLDRCRTLGVEIRSAWVGDHEVFFVADNDGNLFEVKSA